MQLWGKREAEFCLLDEYRARLELPQMLEAFKSFCKRSPLHKAAIAKLVEDKAHGKSIIQTYRRTIEGIVPIKPTDSKKARLEAVTPLFHAGNIVLPRESWVDDYIEEVVGFPTVKHDDRVDTTTQALSYLATQDLFFC
jgi:predicted phage terminase large subunit-like protein